MRYVKIEKVNPGDILAKDIVDNKGNVLLRANSDMTLRENIISLLKSKGINGIYINDEISRGLSIEETISHSVRNFAREALEKRSVEETRLIASKIVEDFNDNIEIDLNRMVDGITYYEKALNICELCLTVGKKLNYSDEILIQLITAALLSKIGFILTDEEKAKLDIPLQIRDQVLQMPIEKTYPLIGKLFSAKAQADPIVIHSVFLHKENEDGTGLMADLFNININDKYKVRGIAKIIHICSDYIDFLIKENDFMKARDMIQKGIIDKKYNYDLASIFLKFIPIYPIGTLVSLSNGDRAMVYKNNEGSPTTPIVKLESGEYVDLSQILNVVISDVDISYTNSNGKTL